MGRPVRIGISVCGIGVGVLLLSACTGTKKGSFPLPTVPTTVATTTTTTPATNVTLARSTTIPSAKPVYVNGVPQVTATPGRSAVGTKVHIEGLGFTDANWTGTDLPLWLTANRPGCAFFAPAQHSVRVTADGHLSGDFIVPSTGGCRQSDVTDAAVTPGPHSIVYQCTACSIGTFTVTGVAPAASAECETVGFTPQSEDAASSIVATGLSCDEARAFIGRLGPMVSTNGPPRIELEGYVCVLTRYEPERLPRAFYECTNGAKKITFIRT